MAGNGTPFQHLATKVVGHCSMSRRLGTLAFCLGLNSGWKRDPIPVLLGNCLGRFFLVGWQQDKVGSWMFRNLIHIDKPTCDSYVTLCSLCPGGVTLIAAQLLQNSKTTWKWLLLQSQLPCP